MQFDQNRWYRIKVASRLIGDASAQHASYAEVSHLAIAEIGESRVGKTGKDPVNAHG
ncbi:hypothetical protein [Bradyrhizobium sp. 2TAF24]|uniref:hypothetical protein n=1 Tax=Bradyrhizobium sp. 2TAF24 TaxID=3233011 RepID=UPI003F9302C2